MKIKLRSQFIFLFLIAIVIFSCRQNAIGTYDYSSLPIDTNKIMIFKWDSKLYTFPKFSDSLALTNNDMILVDSLLDHAVKEYNKINSKAVYQAFRKQVPIDSFIIDLLKYKRQYFPYRDNNGQRVFEIVCFSKPFAEWRNKIYNGGRGAGISKFSLRVNLNKKKADTFFISGYE